MAAKYRYVSFKQECNRFTDDVTSYTASYSSEDGQDKGTLTSTTGVFEINHEGKEDQVYRVCLTEIELMPISGCAYKQPQCVKVESEPIVPKEGTCNCNAECDCDSFLETEDEQSPSGSGEAGAIVTKTSLEGAWV